MRQNRAEKIPVLGITGGVGAGKSAVLSHLSEKYGACTLAADEIAADLEKPGTDCFGQIVKTFGREILSKNGSIDRAAMGELVFSDPDKLKKLDAIVHPAVKAAVKEAVQKRQEERDVPLIVLEAALLIEEHYGEICDEIWYVYADEHTRAERLKASRGYSDEKIRNIMRSQLTDKEFRENTALTLDNSAKGTEGVIAQIEKALKKRGWL